MALEIRVGDLVLPVRLGDFSVVFIVSYPDPLIRSGYQIKIRWVGDGAASLWVWADFFSTLDEAQDYKTKHQGETEPGYGWKLEIEIFEIKRIES